MDQPLDLTFKPSAPMASIIDAYNSMTTKQQALKQSQAELDNQNINRVASVFQGAAEMTSSLVQNAEQRQRRDALMNWLATGGETTTTAVSPAANQPQPTATAMGQKVPIAPATQDVPFSSTPEYKARLRELAVSAFPKDAGKNLSKAAFADLTPKQALGEGAYDVRSVTLPDGTQAIMRTNKVTGETSALSLDGKPVAPGFANMLDHDSAGNIIVVGRQPSAPGQVPIIGKASTAAPGVPPQQVGKVTDINTLPATTRKEVQQRISEATNDPEIQKEKQTYLAMNRLQKAVESDNAAIASKLGIVFQKAMGDSGNISIAEQVMPGSKQILEQAKQAWSTYITTGALSKDNKKIAMQAMDILKKVAQQNYNAAVGVRTDQITQLYPQMNGDYVRKSIGGTLAVQGDAPKPAQTSKAFDLGGGFSYTVK